MTKPIDLKDLSKVELTAFFEQLGEKTFRTDQLWSWMYGKGADNFDFMTNMSKSLREELKKTARLESLKLIKDTISPESNTHKFLWRLDDGLLIESVFIPDRHRRTVCISSQVGCGLGCAFCATARMGFVRDLRPHEMVEQLQAIQKMIGSKPTNLVVMGMGEPFLNYERVIKALSIINDREGLAIGHRKITVSTAGIVPQIIRFADERQPYSLAISLNGTTNDQRRRLMPVTQKYPLEDLLKAAKYYTQKSKKRLTFEYVLLQGINDSMEDAHRLLTILKPIPCKINLIAYNKNDSSFRRPDENRIRMFAESIRPICAPVTLRLSRGDDIHGACGQLAVCGPVGSE